MAKRIDEHDKFANMSIRYPDHLQLREQLAEMAAEESRSLNGQVQYLLLEALESWKIRKKLTGKYRLAYEEFKQELLNKLKGS
jgi:hypothetical protein